MENLAMMTGHNRRVIQVWFQNARARNKRSAGKKSVAKATKTEQPGKALTDYDRIFLSNIIPVQLNMKSKLKASIIPGASVTGWLRMRLTLKLLAPLRLGSNPMRGSCQLLTGGCWFTPVTNLFSSCGN